MTATGAASVASGSEGQERILNAAYERFVGVGYAEVSMQQIADAAGVTKATLYHHFKSKDDLFGAVCRREMQRMRAGIGQQLAAGGAFRARLERVARFFIEHASRADVMRLMSDLDRHLTPEQRHEYMHGEPTPDLPLRELFEEAFAAGELREVEHDLAVTLFFSMLFGQIKFAMRAPERRKVTPDLATAIVDIFLRGVGAAPGGSEG
jgi:AcrR family transcriptional regulator